MFSSIYNLVAQTRYYKFVSEIDLEKEITANILISLFYPGSVWVKDCSCHWSWYALLHFLSRFTLPLLYISHRGNTYFYFAAEISVFICFSTRFILVSLPFLLNEWIENRVTCFFWLLIFIVQLSITHVLWCAHNKKVGNMLHLTECRLLVVLIKLIAASEQDQKK